MSIVVRHHRNKIRCIKNSVGNWLIDEDDTLRIGLKDLYTTELCSAIVSYGVSEFAYCHLSDEESARINKNVIEKEIRSSLWSLKAFKALGPDGLHDGFF